MYFTTTKKEILTFTSTWIDLFNSGHSSSGLQAVKTESKGPEIEWLNSVKI